jgi:hypothetical protein
MKNKLRTITINGEKYVWKVIPNTDDGGNILRIWKDKKLIFDKWLMIAEITPQIIKTILQKNKIVINNSEYFWNHIPNGIEDIITFFKNDKEIYKINITDAYQITQKFIEEIMTDKDFLKELNKAEGN